MMKLNKTIKTILPLAAAMGTLALATSANAATVAVTNDSFEVAELGAGASSTTPTGWVVTGNAGHQRFIPGNTGDTHTPDATDGLQNGYTNGPASGVGSLTQTTAHTINAGDTITLTVDLGQLQAFVGGASSGRLWLYGNTLGNVLTGADSTAVAPITANYTEVSVSYTALASGDPFAGQSIGIGLEGASGSAPSQVLWDNVRLDVTPVPEPTTTALLGLGGLALILRRRK